MVKCNLSSNYINSFSYLQTNFSIEIYGSAPMDWSGLLKQMDLSWLKCYANIAQQEYVTLQLLDII